MSGSSHAYNFYSPKLTDPYHSQPMTCRDFVKYMIYVEHGAENLQFFLWHKDYTERFEKLPESEKVLSPEYKHPTVVPEALVRPRLFGKGNSEKKAAAKIIETAFDMAEKEQNHSPQLAPPSPSWSNPFNTPPTTPDDASSKYGSQLTPFDSVVGTSIGNIDHKAVAMGAYQSANVKVQPCMFLLLCVLHIEGAKTNQ